MSLFNELFSQIEPMEIMDTHEHLPPWEKLREQNGDVFTEYLIHYFSVDLRSAGMSIEDFTRVQSPESYLSPTEKWAIAAPYWERCRTTGYGQSLDIAVRAIYGLDGINRGTVEELDKKFRDSVKNGSYRRVLKEKCNIKKSILDCWGYPADADPDYFITSQNLESIICPEDGSIFALLENLLGKPVYSLTGYLQGVEAYLDKSLLKSRFFKCALAYSRTLDFAITDFHTAEQAFLPFLTDCLSGVEKTGPIRRPGKAFQDYVMHAVLGYLNDKNAVLQIHTGMQEGNGNLLGRSNPEPLCELFLDYPGVSFDIFHTGYPYNNLLGPIAKMFPNVYIDMCWAHIISPPACVNMLCEWFETMPVNKIFGFGGDYCLVDGVYGHQYLARKNITKALAQKVQEGLFTEARAVEIAQMLLRDNVLQLI